MSYEAIVVRLENVMLHPNADRLQVATAGGHHVIVGMESQEGDLGIVFPEGGKLAQSFCLANSLYRKDPVTGEAMGGYLDENGRIKALKLRGAVSEALWLPIESISIWMAYVAVTRGRGPRTSVPVLKEGEHLTEVKGELLCEKYFTPATIARMAQPTKKGKARSAREEALPKHYDTPQLRHVAQLPHGTAIITEKVHGTSGRTGYVQVARPQNALVRAWNFMTPAFFNIKPKRVYEYVSGTRNCIVDEGAPGEKGMGYRQTVHQRLIDSGAVDLDEVWYYEIAGFSEGGAPIMAVHNVGAVGDSKLEKQLKKKFGEQIIYRYGCMQPGDAQGLAGGTHRVFVYRITKNGVDLTWDVVVDKADAAGLETVPVLARIPEATLEKVNEAIQSIPDDCSRIDSSHPIEGVCIRIEHGATVYRSLKEKFLTFKLLEGLAKSNDNYVDLEEAS